MSDVPHPSEALLTRFEHTGFTAEIPTRTHARLKWVLYAQLVALLPILVFAGIALSIDKDPLPVWMMAALFQALPTLWFFPAYFSTARVAVKADATDLTLTSFTETGRRSEQVIPMASIEAAYVIEPQSQGNARRRVRIARDQGDVFIDTQYVPAASAEWLANQIGRIAREAKERAAGEAAPELIELLDQSTRTEAERKLRLQRQKQRT